MFSQLNVFSLLILLGCLQAFVLSALLLCKPSRSASHVLLALLLTLFSLNNLSAVFFDLGWSWQHPFLLIFPFSFILAIGPALYLYLRSSLATPVLSRKDLLHFVPAAIELVWYVGLSVRFLGKTDQILAFYRAYEHYYSLPEQLVGMASVFIYLLFCYRLLKKYSNHPSAGKMKICCFLLTAGLAGWAGLLAADIVFSGFTIGYSFYYPLYLLMSVTVYALGYMGYFIPAASEKSTTQPTTRLEGLSNTVREMMEREKLYLDPELRVKTVADKINCSSTELSACLSQVLNIGFYDFVNAFRLEEVKRRLSDPDNNAFTVAAIAYDCGFKSKSTFNEFFKKNTGCTPREFKLQAQKDVRRTQTDVS